MTGNGACVGVFGLGTMGSGMARSLLRNGIDTVVWDRSPERCAPFSQLGAIVAPTAEEAAARSKVAITMVTDADAVLAVAEEHNMLAALRSDAAWLQMSTVGTAGFERVADLARSKRPDVYLFDAPVSGTKRPAEEGKLTIFASGPDEARALVDPIFAALGQRTIWLGPAGLGSRLKLVNNVMLAFVVEGMGEAISLAHHLELTTEAVIETIGFGPLASPYMVSKLDRIAHGEYESEFSLSLALKDVKLALDAIAPDRQSVVESLAEQWQDAEDRGFGSQDVTAIVRAIG
jgi:3-hydroxyisobutyrate dehydrogenase